MLSILWMAQNSTLGLWRRIGCTLVGLLSSLEIRRGKGPFLVFDEFARLFSSKFASLIHKGS